MRVPLKSATTAASPPAGTEPAECAVPQPPKPLAHSAVQPLDAEWVAEYLAHCRVQKGLAARTLALYQLDLDALWQRASLAKLNLGSVKEHHVRGWLAQMQTVGRSARAVALTLSVWRGFYAWLGQSGRIGANPVRGVHAPRLPKPSPKVLTTEEAVRLAEHTAQGAPVWLQARDAAMVELLYGCGLRMGELIGLDVAPPSELTDPEGLGWIDWALDEVVLHGRDGKRRRVPLGQMAKQAVQRWLLLRPELASAANVQVMSAPAMVVTDGSGGQPVSDAARALFLSQRGGRLSAAAVRQRLHKRAALAGLSTPVPPNVLRHSFASHLLESSQDLRAVQELMGHTHIAATQMYARLDFQHLTKTYDAAHPRAKRKHSGSG